MGFILTAVIMFSFWMLLSGETGFILVLSGVVSSLLVAHMSHDLIFGKVDINSGFRRIIAVLKYIPWLMLQIIISNIDLVYRTLHPSMPIDPAIIKTKNNLRTDLAMVLFANSVTLTPGTVTIEVSENEFIIHAIDRKAEAEMADCEMQKRVKRIEDI